MTPRRTALNLIHGLTGLCVLTVCLLAPNPTVRGVADAAIVAPTPESSQIQTDILSQFSQESQAFYRKIRKSMVTVKLDPNPLHLLPQELQGNFLSWEKKWVIRHDFRDRPAKNHQPLSEPRIIITPDLNNAQPALKSQQLNPAQQQHLTRINKHPRVELFLIRHYLFATHPLPPREFWPEVQLINARLASYQHHGGASISGLVVGPLGCIAIPAVIAPPMDSRPLTVITSDGNKFQAYIHGVNQKLGMTVLLPTPAADRHFPAIALANHPLHPAELLFVVDVESSSAHWIMPLGEQYVAPHSPGRRAHGHGTLHFTGTMGHSPAFVFNLHGHLAAVNLNHGFFPLNNNNHGLRRFLLTGNPRPPRFGILFSRIPPDSPLRATIPDLGNKPAIQVLGTLPHSPAAKAGVKKDDIIIAVDGISVENLPEIHRRIMADPHHVDLTILRHNHKRHITMSLPHPHHPQ